ncbi:unnamed protein product [Rotaria sordida]|uniref:Uncharacterized protein n=1 Tax=Rotaria sordida TaxID=392033 RepID=A0A815ERH2_9BILA|nr:unnamed protein product [Rotaria sordida]CAF1189293.1 unnamed protein product [Rotaria sordida]CAF1315728.1 unnamed protein product [Rotaria sordida]CAF3810000.1 unnamed protein product [Rotaria sordida]CAF4112790.1 unnamed protein product [Rotaria sordida]
MERELVNNSVQTWISALTGGAIIGLLGILPLYIVPNEDKKKEKPYLEMLLSIAVGTQLADVFLHLLPEAFSHPDASSTYIGLWTLIGLFLFFIIEQIFPDDNYQDFNYKSKQLTEQKIKTSGYLNLLANFIDNVTHGAAIGGSFAVSPLIGVTTLAGIIIHEIPHEIGDFAILLQSGFDRWQATKAQFITGLGGLIGASIALIYSNFLHSTLWVLPFTSGAFLYVALVKTLPHLLKQNDLTHSFRQLIGVCGGLCIIYLILIYVG